jgi:hypothetical protein
MKPERLAILRWSPDSLAQVLECDHAVVTHWLVGDAEIPMKTGAWIEMMARVHEAGEAMKPNQR